jgi:hypothetical protein
MTPVSECINEQDEEKYDGRSINSIFAKSILNSSVVNIDNSLDFSKAANFAGNYTNNPNKIESM